MDIAQSLPSSFETEKDIFKDRDQRIAELEHRIEILEAEKAVLLKSKG